MRRGIAKLAPPPSTAAFCTFSGSGGFGRGRGRGSSPSPLSPVPGDDEDPFFSASGHGRGRGRADGPHTSSPHLPSFPSLFPSSSSQGRGRSMTSPDAPPPSAQNPDLATKKPVFFNRHERPVGEDPRREPNMSSFVSALGRGKPVTEHRPPQAVPEQGDRKLHMPKREDAAKRAMEILSRGRPVSGQREHDGTGRDGTGMLDSEPETEEMVGPEIDWSDEEHDQELNEEDLEEWMKLVEAGEDIGEERRKKLRQWVEKLPNPQECLECIQAEEANLAIELEPEYLVNFANPDIEEKPPMSIEEVFETAKPFLMAYEGISSQEEWENDVKHTMKLVPFIKKSVDKYSGPDVVTAKQQQQELQRVANTLPANAPTSVKSFTDRVLLSLQSNPGWGFDKKCQFMDKLAWEVNQHYK